MWVVTSLVASTILMVFITYLVFTNSLVSMWEMVVHADSLGSIRLLVYSNKFTLVCIPSMGFYSKTFGLQTTSGYS